MPAPPLVLSVPLRVTVPVADEEMLAEAAEIAWAVKLCELATVSAPRREVRPQLASRLISPVVPEASVRAPDPLIVFWKVIVWFAAEVSRTGFPVNATRPWNKIGWPAVIDPESVTWLVVPFCVKPPLILPSPAKVRVPLLLTIMGPLENGTVSTTLLKVKLVPVREIPAKLGTMSAPVKVVVPKPLNWVKESTIMVVSGFGRLTSRADKIVRPAGRWPTPTLALKLTLPNPAFKVRTKISSTNPSTVDEKVMSAPIRATVE